MPVLQVVNFVIILIVMVFLVKYLWDMFFSDHYEPAAWEMDRKEGRLPEPLRKVAKHYPDKIRFYNFWLQVERLKREKVEGAFAELGVYKGESAAVIHRMDETRTFYLFDTFEGFQETDLKHETGEAATYTSNHFADTRIDGVLRKIGGNRDLIKVHAGYFPESASGLENEKFALVNIDADLYKPVRAGLEYFYPRLAPGGVIFIHDYNGKWPGLMQAVDEFVASIPENPALMPDFDSTLMIIKNK